IVSIRMILSFFHDILYYILLSKSMPASHLYAEATEFSRRFSIKYLEIYNLSEKEVFYNKVAIAQVVTRYWLDVERIHNYHELIVRIDCHKIGGFLSYWICKIKPFYGTSISYENENSNAALLCNEIISFILSCGRIEQKRIKNKEKTPIKIPNPKSFLSYYIYTLRYRQITQDLLSFVYYFLDHDPDCVDRNNEEILKSMIIKKEGE
ncbi:MAG: hypothetical protein HPY53_16995, partial [Brevinematales bacterium]|nr:hypothetical protein [Brevinematales bacterium]